MPRRPPRKHRSPIRSAHGKAYGLRNLRGALADPDMMPHCFIGGGLCPRLEREPVTEAVLRSLLNGVHPTTGRQLKPVTNHGTRQEGGHPVSNVCFGIDIPLKVSRSVSIASLAVGDPTVRHLAYKTIKGELIGFGPLMDRRLSRRGGSEAVETTGLAVIFGVPEKADRNGFPLLHMHGYFPNLTGKREGGTMRYSAAHFGRILREAAAAQRRVDRKLYRALLRKGYPVEMVGRRCELMSVPRWLVDRWSMSADPKNTVNWQALPDVDIRAERRRQDDEYLLTRKPKVYQSLAAWQMQWEAEIGPKQLATVVAGHYQAIERKRNAVPPSTPRAALVAPPTAKPTDDEVDVLKPISKRILLEAAPRMAPSLPASSPPTCDDIISSCRYWAVRSIQQDLCENTTSSPKRIVVQGSPVLTPWFTQFEQLMELSFPGAVIVTQLTPLAPPQVRAEGTSPQFARMVDEAARQHAEGLRQSHPDIVQRLAQLLALGRTNTQHLSVRDSLETASTLSQRNLQRETDPVILP